jgi:hypothetical protein
MLTATTVNGWKFDIRSSLVTIIVAPLAIFFLAIIKKYLKVWGAYLLEGLMYWASRAFKRSLAGSLTLKRYCRLRLAEDTRYLFVPSSLDVKLEVDKTFVTLTLDHQGGAAAVVTHRDVLTVGNRVRVVGDPGSGKSSLVKKLFRDACFEAIRRSSKAKLPLLLELKGLAIPPKMQDVRLGDWLLGELRRNAEKSAVYQMGDCFDTYSKGPGLLVFLDGLDEVSTASYARVQRAIIGLSQRLAEMSEHNTVLLTMRTQFHLQIKSAFRDSFGQALFLKAFSPSDIYDFLTRWPFASRREHNIARIYGELTDRPTLREMCSNPLILSMYVAEDQTAQHLVAPESRTEFYKRVTEELVIRRRLQQIGATAAHTKLREQREQILGRLAFEHMLDPNQPTNSLHWKAALRITQEVVKCGADEAEAIFSDLAKETGLVTEERKGETFRFIHLTFCEFLGAFECIQGQKDGWATLISVHRKLQSGASKTRLLEVIPFACGLLPRVSRENAISDVTEFKDRALTARCFLETKVYDHQKWPTFCAEASAGLLGASETSWDERWLRDLHLFNVVVKDAIQCSAHMPIRGSNVDLDQFLRTLVGTRKMSLSRLLSAYATQDAAAVFRLAEISGIDLAANFAGLVISNCDQAPFRALVIDKAVTQGVQIEWCQALAEAALRSQAVAEALYIVESVPSLRQRILALPGRKCWFRKGLLEENLLTQIVTLAVSGAIEGQDVLGCLKILKRLKAPGESRFNPSTLLIAVFPFQFLFSAAIFVRPFGRWLAQILNSALGLSRIQSEILFVLLLYGSLFLLLLIHRRRLAFRALLFARNSEIGSAVTRVLEKLPVLWDTSRVVNVFLTPPEIRRAIAELNAVSDSSKS